MSTLKLSVLLILTLCFFSCEHNRVIEESNLKSEFINLSDDNTVWCYWYWIGDDISKEGITKDLLAMKSAGIGAALIGNINPEEKDGKVPMLSEEWWDHMVHAVNEGKRIGVDIGAFNCPGWSQSGGPWITPDKAMRYLTYSETKVEGGQKLNFKLKKPTKNFQDTYVLAFPSIEAENTNVSNNNSKIKLLPRIINDKHLFDNDTITYSNFNLNQKKHEIIIESQQALNVRSLKLIPGKKPIQIICKIFSKADSDWKALKTYRINRSKLTPNVGPDKYAPILISLPHTKGNTFKITFEVPDAIYNAQKKNNNNSKTWELREIILSEAVGLEQFSKKTLAKMHPTPFPAWNSYLWNDTNKVDEKHLKIDSTNLIDISEFMDESGTITWDAPQGNWTIQRIGMSPTGTKNSPSAPQGKGYEVDKASKKLTQYHYSKYIGEFLKRIPEESKSAFKYVIADSYEMGSQNWTDSFEKMFKNTYGYNPKKYLPVFSGRIVNSVETSNRFLWDVRRLIADAVAYEYTGGLRQASNKDGLQLWLENYGHWGFPSEFLMYGGQSDLVSGEFWNEGSLGNIECKSASSAAHIYGKPKVSAEAFTAAQRSYIRHPAMLKKRGDWSFTEGINHIVLHLYIHQPDDNRVPGVNAWFSTEFNRHNTWFKKSKTYFDYLRRCQHMLQQGTYSADVCYFIGENTPIMTGVRQPELPKGYAYDYINAEVILNRLTVEDGKLMLPDGMSYKLMVLPPFKTMRPELIAKIEALVAQGANIYGDAPTKSPSLKNYPESDRIVKNIADKMWGNAVAGVKSYGNGKVINGIDLRTALDSLKIAEDILLKPEAKVLWTHRKLKDKDIYFLTNQSEAIINISPSFRIQDKVPELWDATTGEIRTLPSYTQKDGRTIVPLIMEGLQSWFIVFSEGKHNTTERTENFPKSKTLDTIKGNWTVNFLNKEIGPIDQQNFPKLKDWILHDNDSIKYYSGTAVYKSEFTLNANDNNMPYYINLGKVGIMASVKINGIDIGTSWISPYKLDAKNTIKNGKNSIEVEVVNVWRNRLTGDKQLPKAKQKTWILVDAVKPEEVLVSSGLIGPVTIETSIK